MWESRVLCEISKALWKPFCGFHGADISIADFLCLGVRPRIVSRLNVEDAPGATIAMGEGRAPPGKRGMTADRRIIAEPPRRDGA